MQHYTNLQNNHCCETAKRIDQDKQPSALQAFLNSVLWNGFKRMSWRGIARQNETKKRNLFGIFATVALYLISMASIIVLPRLPDLFTLPKWVGLCIGFLVGALLLWALKDHFKQAFKGLLNKQVNMGTLIFLGICPAWLYSIIEICCPSLFPRLSLYFSKTLMIALILKGGELLQQLLKAHMQRGDWDKRQKIIQSFKIRSYYRVLPKTHAHNTARPKPQLTHINAIQVGDRVRIESGQMIPLDARLISPSADISYINHTGSDRIITQTAGTVIRAGCINKSEQDTLVQIVKKPADHENSLYKKIMGYGKQKKDSERTATSHWPQIFTLLILTTALITGEAWWLTTQDLALALIHAWSVFICICPCTIAVAMYWSDLIVGFEVFKKKHISGVTLPLLKALNDKNSVFISDINGTLTTLQGHEVKFISPKDITSMLKKELIQRIVALEQQALSSYGPSPYADQIIAYAQKHYHFKPSAKDLAMISDVKKDRLLISGQYNDQRIKIGDLKAFKRNIFESEKNEEEEDTLSLFFTIQEENELIAKGCIRFKQQIKSSAQDLFKTCRNKYNRLYLFSGNQNGTFTQAIGKALELAPESVNHGMDPNQKKGFVEKHINQAPKKSVLVLGDSGNDIKALEASTYGIALWDTQMPSIGCLGADLSLPNLSALQYLMDHADQLSNLITRCNQQCLGMLFMCSLFCIGLSAGLWDLLLNTLNATQWLPILSSVCMPGSMLVVFMRLICFQQMIRKSLSLDPSKIKAKRNDCCEPPLSPLNLNQLSTPTQPQMIKQTSPCCCKQATPPRPPANSLNQ